MGILEDIELRLYRYAQEGYRSKDHVKAAQDMALEILNLCTENANDLRELGGAAESPKN